MAKAPSWPERTLGTAKLVFNQGGKSPSGKEKHPTYFSFLRVFVQKGVLVIAGIHLSVLLNQKGIEMLGISVRPSRRTRLEANQRSEVLLW